MPSQPDCDVELVTKDWLLVRLRSSDSHTIVLDCRGSNEYTESHIRDAVNFSIPSIMLRRLVAGKIDLTSTIKCRDLKLKIASCYHDCMFVLYCEGNEASDAASTINMLHRRLKQDGCRVVCLEGGYASFRAEYPEWCDQPTIREPSGQLMGLRFLRISSNDSACSSSADSSDCEGTSGGPKKSGTMGDCIEPEATHVTPSGAPVEILPGLFLGNAIHSRDYSMLEQCGIRHVLNVTPDLPNVFEDSVNFKYLQIPIADHWSQDLSQHFPTAIDFIDEARTLGSAVLVHCLAGVSRSVTVTLAYLMTAHRLSLNEAFTLVRARKADVSPNFHFMRQLHSLEHSLKASSTTEAHTCDDKCAEYCKKHVTMDNMAGKTLKECGQCDSLDSGVSCSCVLESGDSPLVTGSPLMSKKKNSSTGRFTERCRLCKYDCRCLPKDPGVTPTSAHDCVISQIARFTGVSPDSGIEFDRWNEDTRGSTPK